MNSVMYFCILVVSANLSLIPRNSTRISINKGFSFLPCFALFIPKLMFYSFGYIDYHMITDGILFTRLIILLVPQWRAWQSRKCKSRNDGHVLFILVCIFIIIITSSSKAQFTLVFSYTIHKTKNPCVHISFMA